MGTFVGAVFVGNTLLCTWLPGFATGPGGLLWGVLFWGGLVRMIVDWRVKTEK